MNNIVTKGWGYELWIENNELYCGKHLHVLPGKCCSIHYHKNKKETFYILNGELSLIYSDKPEDVIVKDKDFTWHNRKVQLLKKGDSFTLETYTPHMFTSHNSYPCDFIEFSTHHEDSDSYRIVKGD